MGNLADKFGLNKWAPDRQSAAYRRFAGLSEKENYGAWIFQWFVHFQANEDYYAYCEAQREGRHGDCRALEDKIDRDNEPGHLAQLYEDWGDIYRIDGEPINTMERWDAWLDDHIPLFLHATPSIHIVDAATASNVAPGYLRLDIPLGRDKTTTETMVAAFITDYYRNHDVKPVQLAAYALHNPNGKLTDDVLLAVERAYAVAKLENVRYPGTDKKWTHNDIALALCENGLPNVGINWHKEGYLTPEELKRAEQDNVDFRELNLDDRRVQVTTWIGEFWARVRNTIHGKFPCKD